MTSSAPLQYNTYLPTGKWNKGEEGVWRGNRGQRKEKVKEEKENEGASTYRQGS